MPKLRVAASLGAAEAIAMMRIERWNRMAVTMSPSWLTTPHRRPRESGGPADFKLQPKRRAGFPLSRKRQAWTSRAADVARAHLAHRAFGAALHLDVARAHDVDLGGPRRMGPDIARAGDADCQILDSDAVG